MLRRGCPGPPETRRWEPVKSHCVNGFAGGPTVAWSSGSVVIATGATNTAVTDAGRKRADNKRGPPTEGIRQIGAILHAKQSVSVSTSKGQSFYGFEDR